MSHDHDIAESVPREAVDLIGQIVQANVDSLAATNDRLREYEQRQTREMAQAFLDLYDGVQKSRRVISTPTLDDAIYRAMLRVNQAAEILAEEASV